MTFIGLNIFLVASPIDEATITPPPTLAENAILLFVFKFFKINLSAKKTVDAQIIETLSGSSIAYCVNRFVLKNDYNNKDLLNKLGIIVFADIDAEI